MNKRQHILIKKDTTRGFPAALLGENEICDRHINCVTKSQYISSSKKNSGTTHRIKNFTDKQLKVVWS